jgi:hypothetical protein
MLPKKEGEMLNTIGLPTEPGALLGFTKHGQPIFLIAGGAPDDDGDGDGDGAGDGDGDGAEDGADGGDGDGDGADAGDGDGDDTSDADGQQGGDAGGKKPPASKRTRQPATRTQDADDPTAGLKKALASERAARKKADVELKELRLKHASAEERQLLEAKETAATEAEARVKVPLIKVCCGHSHSALFRWLCQCVSCS